MRPHALGVAVLLASTAATAGVADREIAYEELTVAPGCDAAEPPVGIGVRGRPSSHGNAVRLVFDARSLRRLVGCPLENVALVGFP